MNRMPAFSTAQTARSLKLIACGWVHAAHRLDFCYLLAQRTGGHLQVVVILQVEPDGVVSSTLLSRSAVSAVMPVGSSAMRSTRVRGASIFLPLCKGSLALPFLPQPHQQLRLVICAWRCPNVLGALKLRFRTPGHRHSVGNRPIPSRCRGSWLYLLPRLLCRFDLAVKAISIRRRIASGRPGLSGWLEAHSSTRLSKSG